MPRVPIIAVTGNATEACRRACLAARMDECLFKPFALTELAALLGRHRLLTDVELA